MRDGEYIVYADIAEREDSLIFDFDGAQLTGNGWNSMNRPRIIIRKELRKAWLNMAIIQIFFWDICLNLPKKCRLAA